MAYDVFISHSSRDAEVVDGLRRLLDAAGIRAYVATNDNKAGTNLGGKIERQIDLCRAVVALITPDSSTSTFVQQEIGYARRARKPIIPVVHDESRDVDLAFLKGMEFIPFSPETPDTAPYAVLERLRRLRLIDNAVVMVLGAALVWFLMSSAE